MTNRVLDWLLGILLLALSGALYWGAGQFPEHAIEAGRYVRFLAYALGVFSLLLILATTLKNVKGKPRWFVEPKRFLIALLLTVAYVFVTKYLGFYLATAIYVPVLGWMLGFRRPVLLILTTAILLGLLWLVFQYFLSVPVPAGKLW